MAKRLIVFFFLWFPMQLHAQNWWSRLDSDDPVTRKTALKLDLMSPLFDMFNAELELVLNKESSLTTEILWQSVIEDSYDFFKTGGRVNYRFYLGKQPAPSGIYVAAGLGAFRVEGVEKRVMVFTPGAGYAYHNRKTTANEVAAFVWLGHQRVFKNRISLEYAVGTGYTFNPIDFDRYEYFLGGRYALYGNLRIGFLLGKP